MCYVIHTSGLGILRREFVKSFSHKYEISPKNLQSLVFIKTPCGTCSTFLDAPAYPPRRIGTQNSSSKTGNVPSFPGYMKSKRDHSSLKLFCTGAPLRISRWDVNSCLHTKVTFASGLRIL